MHISSTVCMVRSAAIRKQTLCASHYFTHITAKWSTGAQRVFPPVVHCRKMFNRVTVQWVKGWAGCLLLNITRRLGIPKANDSAVLRT